MEKLIMRSATDRFWRELGAGSSQFFEQSFVYSRSDLSSVCGGEETKLTLEFILDHFGSLRYLTRYCPLDFNGHTFKLKLVESKVFKGKSWIQVNVFKGDVQVVGILPQTIESDYCPEFTKWIKYNNKKIKWSE